MRQFQAECDCVKDDYSPEGIIASWGCDGYSEGKLSFRRESLAFHFNFAKSYGICHDSKAVANQDSGDRSQNTSVRQKRDQKIASLLILIVTVFGCCNLVICMCVRSFVSCYSEFKASQMAFSKYIVDRQGFIATI